MTTLDLSFLVLAASFLLLGLIELVTACFWAPEGFEDRDGFHIRFVRA